MSEMLRYLRRILRPPSCAATDRQLLELFTRQGEETAFESLVARHGPMVLGICRRVLGNEADAEDAFQASFLVLVRKARSLQRREKLKNWLYGVACRTALEARRARAKRRAKEAAPAYRLAAPHSEPESELRYILDEELALLPDKYREVIILCDLEGMGRKEAARELACPEGTIASRLARGRALLAKRLMRRGLGLTTGALMALISSSLTRAAVPPSWFGSTMQAVNMLIRGAANGTEASSARSAALVEGVMRSMLLDKLKMTAALLLALGFLTAGTVTLSYHVFAAKQPNENHKTLTHSDPGHTPMVNVWQERAVLKDHDDLVHGVAFTPDGKRFASVGGNGSVIVYETANTHQKTLFPNLEVRVFSLAFSPDGKTLASGNDGMLILWDVATKKQRTSWMLNQSIVSLAFSPDGKTLAMGYGSGNLQIWDVAAGKEQIALEGSWRDGGGGPGLLATTVGFSPDGKLLAAGRFDHNIKLWHATTGKEQRTLEGHSRPVFSVSFAPDGKTLASGSGDGTVRLWDVGTGKEKAILLREARWVLSVVFSPDGRTVAAGFLPKGEKEYQVKLWDVKSGEERAVLKGYSDEGIIALAFSPDGRMLATACGDFYSGRSAGQSEDERKKKGEVKLWELVRRPAKK